MDAGPVLHRRCQDLICCLVFLAFLVGMVGVSGYGFVYGDPQLFLTMWDADGKGCGYDAVNEGYNYLYWPIIDIQEAQKVNSSIEGATRALLQFGTCVKKCPTKDDAAVECRQPNYMLNSPNFENKPCVYTIRLLDVQSQAFSNNPDNWNYNWGQEVRYDTTTIGGKVCFPVIDPTSDDPLMAPLTTFYNDVLQKLTQSGVTDYVEDTIATWHVLLIGLGSAFLLGFVYLILLRWIAAPVVWCSIALTLAAMGGAGYVVWTMGEEKPESDEYKLWYTYGSYALWGICGLFLLCLLCNCRNIKIGIAIM